MFDTNDPALNAAVFIVLAALAFAALAMGAFILIPILVVLGIAKGVHWYMTLPTPTDQLYAQTQQRSVAANFPDQDAFLKAHIDRLLAEVRDNPPAYEIFLTMVHITETLYEAENLNNPLPPLRPANAIEEGRYRDQLIAHQRKTADAPRTLEVVNSVLGACYLDFVAALPPMAKTTPDEFEKYDDVASFATFPLIDVVPEPAKLITPLILSFFRDDVEQLGLFASMRRQLDRNFHEASGMEYPGPNHKLIMPEKYKGTPAHTVSAYLHDTPLEALFYASIPFAFTDRQRFEHTHVVGGSGHGKTQLLQRIIYDDLQRPSPPSLIVVDSQGEMLSKIQNLRLFAPNEKLADKIICIDPEDVDHPPALNMFALPTGRMAGYSQSVREQVEAGTIELFNYIFGAIAAELTSRQNTTFAYVTRLMLSIPGATIHTLRELFEDAALSIDTSPFAAHIRALDPTSQGFFANQFFTKSYVQTKSQIARRLYGVLQVPSFDRMFSAKDNKLDMFEAMQSGKVVLINTSKALLKSDASGLFGRTMIARAIAAAFERIALPTEQRNPALLIVDEAAEYFDENLETLLSQARKFNVGVLFAHQHLDQLSPTLRASVAANTSIKLAGGVSDRDARALAADMRTTPEFITGMTKRARSTEFACFVRNYTANAVRLEIPFGLLESAATMSETEHSALRGRNRERFATRLDRPRTAATDLATSRPNGLKPIVPVPESPSSRDSNRQAEAGDDWRS